MPKPSPQLSPLPEAQLASLGAHLRAKRKALRVSATAAAEAAGVSRVTLHRIEKGEPSVTMGAWCSVMAAVGLHLQAHDANASASEPSLLDRTAWIPVRIVLAQYPQLQALAWQVHGTETLTPLEAVDIYERNARHIDKGAMTESEQALWQALQEAFGRKNTDV